MFQCHSPKTSHPLPLPQSPKDCSIHQCLFCCLIYRVNLCYCIIPDWLFFISSKSLLKFLHLLNRVSSVFISDSTLFWGLWVNFTLFALNYFLLKVFLAFSFHCNCCLQGFSCALLRVEPLLRYKESPSDGAEPRRKVTSRSILFTTLLDRILPVFAAGSESAPYIWLC